MIAEVKPDQDPTPLIRDGMRLIHDFARESGAPRNQRLRVLYNANESLDVLGARVDALIEVRVTDVVIGVDFDDTVAAAEALTTTRKRS
ncbi:hypothetical protein [Mycolicibacterium setense]